MNAKNADELPLAGVRVVDLTRVLSGPFCTALLADLGADIVKVETPGEGDTVRAQGAIVNGFSSYFANYNRNKRGITLNLRKPEGRDILARLIAQSDVLMDNYRPGVLEAMGFDAARLAELNPRLVRGSITGFGNSGPYRDRPSFDFIAQAMSGFMAVNGAPDQPPMRSAPPVSDLVAGLYAALGIVAGLLRRERVDAGATASVSLTGGLISFLAFIATDYLATGNVPARTGNDHPIAAPYGLFRTADEAIAIAPAGEAMYQRLLRAGCGVAERTRGVPRQRRAGAQPGGDQCGDRGAHAHDAGRTLDPGVERGGGAVLAGDAPAGGVRRSAGCRAACGGDVSAAGAGRDIGAWLAALRRW